MKKISIQPISKENTNLLKGVAIILIVLHNYYKWINPITGENEFGFSLSHIIKSYIYVRSSPLEILNVVFNFLGHYGVQAFIFISAYGLTISYQRRKTGYGTFILHRLNRIYPSLVLAAIVFIIFKIIMDDSLFIGTDVLTDLGFQLSLIANFIPGKAIAITGPWWFYSMIFQFYLLFPFFMWINKKTGISGLIVLTALGYAFTILLNKPLDNLSLNTQFFLPGHLPEFCLGIMLAGRKEVKIPVWLIFLAFGIFIGGNLVEWLWPFTFLSVTLLIILLVQPLFKMSTHSGKQFPILSFFGMISMYLFACHGFLRGDFIMLANRLASPLAALIIGLIYLLFSAGIAFLMKQTELVSRAWINKPEETKFRYLHFLALFFIIAVSLFVLSTVSSRADKKELEESAILYVEHYDFEKPDAILSGRFSDTIFFEGRSSFIMPSQESYTPPMEVDFDTIKIDKLWEVSVSAMIYTEDTLAEGHIIMEIYDKSSNYRMAWISESFNSNTQNYRSTEWFIHTSDYKIPPYYLKPDYRLKVYLWNNSQGGFFVDNIELALKAKQN